MNRKIIPAICILFCFAVLFISFTAKAQGYQVGSKAKDFSLKNVDGNMVSMKDNASAKGYIVVFTCNTCPFSVKYEDRIIALHNKYAPMGYPVIAINPNDVTKQPDDSFEKMQARAKDKGFTFPYLTDETQEIAKTYGAARTPHVYIVKKVKDDFTVEYIGAIDDNTNDGSKAQKKYIENAMTEILAGKKVSTANTKAIGCTIKWKDA